MHIWVLKENLDLNLFTQQANGKQQCKPNIQIKCMQYEKY